MNKSRKAFLDKLADAKLQKDNNRFLGRLLEISSGKAISQDQV